MSITIYFSQYNQSFLFSTDYIVIHLRRKNKRSFFEQKKSKHSNNNSNSSRHLQRLGEFLLNIR